MKKLNNLNYIVVTPDRRKQTRLCHENMLKPLVESSSNLVKELANVNVFASEPKELSGELSSSHLRPTDTTKLTNYNVLQNLNSKLSYLKESQRQDLNKPLQEYKELFADVPSKTDQMYHDVDVSDAATVNQHPYRLHPNKQQYLKYVMKFDLLKGFWQVLLTDHAKEISAFLTPEGLYQYKVMPLVREIHLQLSSALSTKSSQILRILKHILIT